MSIFSKQTDFFVAGGTLSLNVPSYVERPADDELFNLAIASKFCYVLTARQMGKSSLMIRTARRLQLEGAQTAIIDLTQMGNNAIDTWYMDLITEIADQLDLDADPEEWWQARSNLGQVRRLSKFLRDVVLTEIEGTVVIFIDEIDSTLGLSFSDDFFTAIRAVYNARAKDPAFARLTFVLIGVAAPSDLIKDRTRTPFNIGEGVTLSDLDRADTAVMRDGLEKVYPVQGEMIFDRIYYWTNGQPYLTQKLCREVVQTNREQWTTKQIDDVVEGLFLSEQARKEINFETIRDKILTHAQRKDLLTLYRQVYQGKQIVDEERSPVQNQLKLAGLVKPVNGYLRIRNELYRQVFNLKWIKENTQRDWNRIIARVAIAVAILVIVATAGIFWNNTSRVPGQAQEITLSFYQAANNSEEQLNHLARLFELQGLLGSPTYDNEARELFFGLETGEEQIALFDVEDDNIVPVIKGLYVTLADVDNSNRTGLFLQRMVDTLEKLPETTEISDLQAEINNWIQGRTSAAQGQLDDALAKYDGAINSNGDNLATQYERARLLITRSENEQALNDLDSVMGIAGRSTVPTPTAPPGTFTPTPTVPVATDTPVPLPTSTSTPVTDEATALPPETVPEGSAPVPAATKSSVEIPSPVAIPTPAPPPLVKLDPEFVTPSQIIGAVRNLINSSSTLVSVLVNALDTEYPNLREFGLVPIPTATPTFTVTATPTATPSTEESTATITPTPTATIPSSNYGLVTDVGGIDDKGFNQLAWKGMQTVAAELGVEVQFLESQQQTDYEKNINEFLGQGYDGIITVGFLLADVTRAASEANPDVPFAIVDFSSQTSGDLGLLFEVDESSFQAGYLAAGMSETGTVCTYGGIKIPPVVAFMVGFENGVNYYNEQKGTSVNVLGWKTDATSDGSGDGSFTGNFESLDDGRSFAENFFDQGCDIIFPIAGPVGLGSAAAAQDRGLAMIGVDADMTQINPDAAEVYLTSVLKKIDVTVAEAIKQMENGTFEGGTNFFGTAANGGVGLAPFHDWEDRVPQDLRDELAIIEQGLIDGSISTGWPVVE